MISLLIIYLLLSALGKTEDLLVEMKMDVTRLPTELAKLPSVSKQLKLDEISTLTKMALRGEVVPASVITQAPPTTSVIADGNSMSSTHTGERTTKSHFSSSQKSLSSSSSAIKKEKTLQDATKWAKVDEKQQVASNNPPAQFTTGSLVSIPAGNSGLRLQTPEGQQLIVAATSVPYTAFAQSSKPQTATVGGGTGATSSYALKVPSAYVDGGQVYQTLQLVPVSAATAQQLMLWPQAAVVQQQPQVKSGTGGTAAQQLTVVQGSQLISIAAATTNAQGGKGGGAATGKSIITID